MTDPAIDLNDKKILIVRLSALGDVIRTIPSVCGLMRRFPRGEFHWLVENSSAGLLRALPGVKLIEIDRKATRGGNPWRVLSAVRAAARRVRAEGFDCAIDFHGVLKSGMYPLLARVPLRIGYDRGGSIEGHRWLINRRLKLPDAHISRYQRSLALAQFIDPAVEPATPAIELAAEARDRIDQSMADRPMLLFPGVSARGRYKRWPGDHWAWLYARIQALGLGPVRFVFGPADSQCRAEIVETLGGEPEALPPFTVPELAHALTRARLFVACDTGPMHLASVLDVPLVALYGPSDPVISQPLSSRLRELAPWTPCAPCRRRDCSALICQTSITPKRVFYAVQSLLAELEAR